MLIETRLNEIASLVNEKGSVTVQELMEQFDASESTIRRNLNLLDEKGALIKVHGGAIAVDGGYHTRDDKTEVRSERHQEEKRKIAQYAASLIEENDLVYLDAGTTIDFMIPHLNQKKAVFVTNSVLHARKLAQSDCKVYILAGEFKAATDAIVGEQAISSLEQYNFTKGFFGTNGITEKNGLTTPDIREALLKKAAISNCQKVYVLADHSKFGVISSATFAHIKGGTILTDEIKEQMWKKYKNVKEVTK